MPKAITTKGRPAACSTTKARRRRASPSPSDTADRDPKPSLELDKSLVLEIIVAKLDSSKTFDWFSLAQKLGSQDTTSADNVTTRVSPAVPGSKAQKRGPAVHGHLKEARVHAGHEWTGAQLHELYHNAILPALKEGRPLWTEPTEIGTPSTVVEPPMPVDHRPAANASARKRREITASPEPAMPVTPSATVPNEVTEMAGLEEDNEDGFSDAYTAPLEDKRSAPSSDGRRAPRSTPRRYSRKAAVKYSYSSDSDFGMEDA